MPIFHAKPKPHDPKWGRWYEGRNRKGIMRRSRICLYPGCKRRQTAAMESDDEFFSRMGVRWFGAPPDQGKKS